MKEIVVYDFDKTLTYKDTLFGFFKAVSKKNIFYPLKVSIYFFFMIIAKLKLISNTTLKSVGVNLFLKGLDKTFIQTKSKEYSKTVKTNKIYKQLIDKNKSAYIITGSFKEYIQPLFPKNIKIISSKLDFKDNKVDKLNFNCYKENKIDALKQNGIESIDIFYTDSMADLEVAKISKKIFIVKKDDIIKVENIKEFCNFFKSS